MRKAHAALDVAADQVHARHRPVDGAAHPHPLSPASPASLLHLQRTAGNRAVAGLVHVQRVKDAFGEKLESNDLRLAPAFQNKHVAADAAGAIATTDWRYRNGKMPKAMEQGRMPNTVASSQTWLDALDASGTQVDTEDAKWTKGVAMDVPTAWQVRWRPRTNDYGVTPANGLALSAGGYGEAVYAGAKGRAAKQVVAGKFLVDHIENA